MNSGKVVLSLLAGIAAGAALGVLFAPDKGSNTRSKLSKKGQDYLDELKKSAKEQIKDVAGNVTSKVQDFKKEVKQSVDGQYSQGKPAGM